VRFGLHCLLLRWNLLFLVPTPAGAAPCTPTPLLRSTLPAPCHLPSAWAPTPPCCLYLPACCAGRRLSHFPHCAPVPLLVVLAPRIVCFSMFSLFYHSCPACGRSSARALFTASVLHQVYSCTGFSMPNVADLSKYLYHCAPGWDAWKRALRTNIPVRGRTFLSLNNASACVLSFCMRHIGWSPAGVTCNHVHVLKLRARPAVPSPHHRTLHSHTDPAALHCMTFSCGFALSAGWCWRLLLFLSACGVTRAADYGVLSLCWRLCGGRVQTVAEPAGFSLLGVLFFLRIAT